MMDSARLMHQGLQQQQPGVAVVVVRAEMMDSAPLMRQRQQQPGVAVVMV
jgi:hypothetical protein